MDFRECLAKNSTILMEGALGERLKREYNITFDESVAMASLALTDKGKKALAEIWNGYIDIARRYGFPFIATTPTRRANKERILKSDYSENIIKANVSFLKSLKESSDIEMYVGGLMGCKGDAYTGEGALTEQEAYEFHSWTAMRFLEAGAEFLYAGIMPTLPEAAGFSRAAEDTNLPYIISFTVQADGRLIDGTSISDAITYIDNSTKSKPECYMANCVHPQILFKALSQPFNKTDAVQNRFKGIQANTSPLSYAELDGSKELKCSAPEEFAEDMLRLAKIGSFQIWGGCCGTDDRHIESLARRLNEMKDFIAYCGLDCGACEARLATIKDDNDMREKVAKKWSELNGVEITPQMINCTGCRVSGVKTPFCDSMCQIRKCGMSKKYETCGSCKEMQNCEKLAMIIKNNPTAKSNLKAH